MKRILVLCLCLLITVGLSGCISPQEKDEKSKKEIMPEILIMGSAVDLYNIDPAVGFDNAISSTLKNLYDNLYRHVDNPPRVEPWLAEKYLVSDDAKEWTFFLNEEAKFHDGSPVTADAVKYSVNRVLEIGKGPASLFLGVIDNQSTVVIDDHTVKFKLLMSFAPFLDVVPWLFIVNPSIVEANRGDDFGQTWLMDHEAGSGPFTIKNWVPGEVYEFVAFEDYWKGWPEEERLAGYKRKVIRDASQRTNELEKGAIHIADWMSPEDQLVLKDVNGKIIVDEPTLNTYEIKLNNQNGYTSDVHVRRAISYAFDYEALANIWAGRAELLQGPLPAGSKWLNTNMTIYRLNLNKAREELAKSSWPNGGFELDYVYVTGLEEERLTGLILKDQLAKINITVNIIPMSWTDAVVLFEDIEKSPDMFPLYSSSAYPDPNNYLWSGYHSSQAGQWTNPGHYKNANVNSLLENARKIINEKNRKELYDQAQELIVEDAVNIFGVSPPDFHVWSQNIKGFDYCPVQGSDEEFYLLSIED